MKSYLVPKISAMLCVMAVWLMAQSDLAITVTNQNLGLVHETRQINLKKGLNDYLLTDIPQQIDATSVLIESLKKSFSVLEQNYEYDLINVDKVLAKSIDQQIWVVDPALGKISGTLLASNASYLMLLDGQQQLQIIPRNDKQKVLLKNYARHKHQFITRPTLVWKVQAEKSGTHAVGLTYLTGGLDWYADYVGKLNADDSKLQLACWVTINNTSGKVYKNARLKLMAGDLNLVKKTRRRTVSFEDYLIAPTTRKQQFEEKAFFEYHLYTLQRKTTLLNNQVKQIQLFPETDVRVQKKFVVSSYQPDKVAVKIAFKNSKQNNLGIPFPAGMVRLYKEDQQDLEFIGEDQIKHTPKDEEILLNVGNAFDIVSERNVLKREKPSKQTEKLTVEYKIRNHKRQDVVVEVIEYLPSYREVELLSSSLKPIETRAKYFKFQLKVKANDESRLEMKYFLQ